jgi:geranylgeranyl reductase family protein
MSGRDFDVLVAGGGPAGSMTAFFLAKAGIRTALIDKSTFPRVKACGGGLQARALADIPFSVSHLFRGALRRMSLSYQLRDSWTRTFSEPLVYCILRTEFDHYLLQQAQRAGAHIMEAATLTGVEVRDDGPIFVRVGSREFRVQCLVGADGANSVVRSLLNQRQSYFWQAAVYCELPEEMIASRAFSPDAMTIDWGTLPSGYAWLFPKQGYVNVGAGGPVGIAKHLKSYAANFVKKIGLLPAGSAERLNFVGHQLPTLTRKAQLAGKRMLLVGDAAGLVEPFTGDGISFSCKSARVAAEHICRALNSRLVDLTEYGPHLISQLGSELLWSRKLVSISTAFPQLIYRLFRTNDRVWETFCRTLRGEETFHSLKKDILGPFDFAWKAIELFTRFRERSVWNSKSLAGQLH